MELDFELEEAFRGIIESNAKSICLQFPEGLKARIIEIEGKFRDKFRDSEFYCLTDPCFGACDLAVDKAKALDSDLLIHFGHAPMIVNKSTIYVPLMYKANESEMQAIFKKIFVELEKDGTKAITMAAPVQYLKIMNEISGMLEKKGINVILSGGNGGRVKLAGQVLGCNYTSVRRVANVGIVVFIGDALFHAIGLSLGTKKRIVFYDASEMKIRDISKEKELFLRKRFAAIAMAKDAKTFGILISTKQGQKRRGIAVELKKEIEARSGKAILLAADYLLPEYFTGINVDCYVNTACPRIAIDDSPNWKKPIINPRELEIALGMRDWEEYRLDEME